MGKFMSLEFAALKHVNLSFAGNEILLSCLLEFIYNSIVLDEHWKYMVMRVGIRAAAEVHVGLGAQ